jgi:hypothetical protein
LSFPRVSVGNPVVYVTLTADNREQHNDGFPATTSGMTRSYLKNTFGAATAAFGLAIPKKLLTYVTTYAAHLFGAIQAQNQLFRLQTYF